MAQQAAAHQRGDSGGRGQVHRRCQGQRPDGARQGQGLPHVGRAPLRGGGLRRRLPPGWRHGEERDRPTPRVCEESAAALLPGRRVREPARPLDCAEEVFRPVRSGQTATGQERVPAARSAGFRSHVGSGFPLVCRGAPGRIARTVQTPMPARLPRRDQLRRRAGGPLDGRARRDWLGEEHRRRLLERPRLLHGRAHLVGREAQQLRRRNAQLPDHRHAQPENRRPAYGRPCASRRSGPHPHGTLRPARKRGLPGPQPEAGARRSAGQR